ATTARRPRKSSASRFARCATAWSGSASRTSSTPRAESVPSVIDIGPDGRAQGLRYAASATCDERRAGAAIELLVVHAISLPPGEFGGPGIEKLFLNRLDPREHPYYAGLADLRVSAHFLVRRDGECVQ